MIIFFLIKSRSGVWKQHPLRCEHLGYAGVYSGVCPPMRNDFREAIVVVFPPGEGDKTIDNEFEDKFGDYSHVKNI